MEEPSWLQQDSLQATHFDYTVNDSPPQTPKIKAHANQRPRNPAAAESGSGQGKRVLHPQKYGNGMAGRKLGPDESLDDIMSFVKEKVCLPKSQTYEAGMSFCILHQAWQGISLAIFSCVELEALARCEQVAKTRPLQTSSSKGLQDVMMRRL